MKAKNAILISALALSGLYFVFLLLSLLGVFNISAILYEDFNYLIAMACIIACLGLYTIALFIENHNNLVVPTWLSISFYICFFVFTNIYYLFGLYNIIYTNLIFYVALSVLISILSISIYYNCLKADDGTLKNKTYFTGFMLFCISITISVIFELVVMFIKFCFNTNINLTTHALASFGILILGATIFSILFHASINKTKRFANACLIKVNMNQVAKTQENNIKKENKKSVKATETKTK